MTAPYEAEVRVPVAHVEGLRRRLEALGAQTTERYAFTDHYYAPAGARWRPEHKTLRIREFPAGAAEVLFSRIAIVTTGGVTFKRSGLSQGKALLLRAPVDQCRILLDDLGFVRWLVVRKLQGELIAIPGAGMCALEEIDGAGWWLELEVEGSDPAVAATALAARLAQLQIAASEASALPMAALLPPRTQRRRLYFCAAIRGGRRLAGRYARLIASLKEDGWDVLTEHVGAPEVSDREQQVVATSAEIQRRDMAWLQQADVVVAEVTVPSLGVGVEIAEALRQGLPVIALVEAGTALSALIDGDERITLIRYDDEAALVPVVRDVLAGRVAR